MVRIVVHVFRSDLSCARPLAGWRDANFGGNVRVWYVLMSRMFMLNTFTSFQNCVNIFINLKCPRACR